MTRRTLGEGVLEGERRIRFWRRPQVEEILLSLLGAYERARNRERAG